MKTSVGGVLFIQNYESLKLKSYQCAAGIWSIGYGTTAGIVEGLIINRHIADALFKVDLEKFEYCVNAKVDHYLLQEQFDALVSLVYNIGCGAFERSKLLKRINAMDSLELIKKEWCEFRLVNGKVYKGLELRRADEIELWRDGDYTRNYRK